MQSKRSQIRAAANPGQRPSWWRGRAFIVSAGLVGALLLTVLAALAIARAGRPCGATFRAPQLAKGVCLADNAAAALDAAEAKQALQSLTRGWEQGDRRDFVPVAAARAAVQTGDVSRACEWLERALEVGVPDRAQFDAPPFAQVRDSPCFTTFLKAHARKVADREVGLTRSTPEEAGLDPVALARLIARAKGTQTSALVIVRNGAIVHEWYAAGGDSRTDLSSATRAIAGLAIGLLFDEARIASADAPLSLYFPEWRQGEKSKATLRHVLSHSSGLSDKRRVQDLLRSDDLVREAIEEALVAEPGSRFSDAPVAANLLPGVVLKVTGAPLDAYLAERLFAPLGIRDWDWQRDRAGNPHGMSGLSVHPLELAKLGVMLAQGGRWRDRVILSEEWVKQALRQATPTSRTQGFFFVVHPRHNHRTLDAGTMNRLRTAGLSAATLKALQPLLNRPLEERDFIEELLRVGGSELYLSLRERDLLPPLQTLAEDVGASAVGSGGIHLTVFPSEGLVAVRTTRAGAVPDEAIAFPDFVNRVRALLPALAPESVAATVR